MSSEAQEHPLDGRIEPEAKSGMDSVSEAALLSIAISLKRIADALPTGDNAQTLLNWVDNAVHQWGNTLGRSFEGGRR